MLYVLIIAIAVLVLDQVSKLLVVYLMQEGEVISIIPNFFRLTSERNDGAAWSASIPYWLLIVITVVALGFFIYLAKKIKFKTEKWYGFSLGFLFGGAIGNFIDRLFYPNHEVVDFLSFILYYPAKVNGSLVFSQYYFPVFNIADSFLVIGVIMFIIYLFFIEPAARKKAAKKKEDESSAKSE